MHHMCRCFFASYNVSAVQSTETLKFPTAHTKIRQSSLIISSLSQMALMKHKGLFDLLKNHGKHLLDTKFQSCNGFADHRDAALQTTRIAIETMLEELAPNLWEDDLDRLVDFGHLISPELEMVSDRFYIAISNSKIK